MTVGLGRRRQGIRRAGASWSAWRGGARRRDLGDVVDDCWIRPPRVHRPWLWHGEPSLLQTDDTRRWPPRRVARGGEQEEVGSHTSHDDDVAAVLLLPACQ